MNREISGTVFDFAAFSMLSISSSTFTIVNCNENEKGASLLT